MDFTIVEKPKPLAPHHAAVGSHWDQLRVLPEGQALSIEVRPEKMSLLRTRLSHWASKHGLKGRAHATYRDGRGYFWLDAE